MQHWRVEDFWDRVFRPTRRGQCASIVFRDTSYEVALRYCEAVLNYIAAKPWIPYDAAHTEKQEIDVPISLKGETIEVSGTTQEGLVLQILRQLYYYWRDSLRSRFITIVAIDLDYPSEEKVLQEGLTNVPVTVAFLLGTHGPSSINWRSIFPGYPFSFTIDPLNPFYSVFDSGEQGNICGMGGFTTPTCSADFPADIVVEHVAWLRFTPKLPPPYYFTNIVTPCWFNAPYAYNPLPPNFCPVLRQELQVSIDNFDSTITFMRNLANVPANKHFIYTDLTCSVILCCQSGTRDTIDVYTLMAFGNISRLTPPSY